MHEYTVNPGPVIRLPSLFRAAVSRILFSITEDVEGYTGGKSECKMTAAMRKKNEELTINLKCTIGVLMTDWG